MLTHIFALSLSLAAPDFTDAPIVPQAVALEEPGRYRSPRNFDDTVEFYKRVFKSHGGVRWVNIINQQGIKAKHLRNLRKRGNWAGINIYESKGRVRFYVVPRKK